MKKFCALRGQIIRNHMTIASLADKLHISTSAMTNKMNGRSPFTINEAIAICDMLNIPIIKIKVFFQEEI